MMRRERFRGKRDWTFGLHCGHLRSLAWRSDLLVFVFGVALVLVLHFFPVISTHFPAPLVTHTNKFSALTFTSPHVSP